MTDQHRAGGAETPNGRSAAGFASRAPESTPARGSSPASDEGASTSPDAASIEEHLTGKKTSATSSSASTPARATTGKDDGEESTSGSAAGEKPATGKQTATRGGPATGPTAEPESEAPDTAAPETAGTSGKPKASKARGGHDEAAAPAGESATGTPSESGTRAGTSGRGRSAIATVSGDGRSGGAATATAAAAGSGGDSPDTDAGFPGRPKKPLLAGAAMAGAILIAVPLLIMATGKDDDDSKEVASSSSADTVLDDDGSKSGPSWLSRRPQEVEGEEGQEVEVLPLRLSGEGEGEGRGPAAATQPLGVREGQGEGTPGRGQEAGRQSAGRPDAGADQEQHERHLRRHPGNTSGSPDGPAAQSWCNSSADDNQLWNVEKKYNSAGPGGAPLFQIRNVMDSMCLDLPGYGAAGNAQKVTEFPCNGTTDDNQLWWLDKQADGRFWIRNFASNNQCLDSYKMDESLDLIIWPCAPENLNNHEWYFTRH
ncbi:RICIN domain-containing protein [Streptomyces sp. FXJ1.4098]|nr:RICIN domain-containing protein [Streptomyces sp. FXJ1.4098]